MKMADWEQILLVIGGPVFWFLASSFRFLVSSFWYHVSSF